MVPIDHQAESAQLAPEILDGLGDDLFGVGADSEGVVLRVDAEGVEPNGFEDIVTLQTAGFCRKL
jgi:hypothetical protein